jgi:hypothetical protein
MVIARGSTLMDPPGVGPVVAARDPHRRRHRCPQGRAPGGRPGRETETPPLNDVSRALDREVVYRSTLRHPWRVQLPRVTGRPASFQALNPPSRCATSRYPRRCIAAAPRAERPPEAQYRIVRASGSRLSRW